MARFEFKFNGDMDVHEWESSGEMEIRLPGQHADLKDQRAAVRALGLLFPDTDVTVLSHTDLPDGGVVTRTVKMDIKKKGGGDG